jgi:hypothetical protein
MIESLHGRPCVGSDSQSRYVSHPPKAAEIPVQTMAPVQRDSAQIRSMLVFVNSAASIFAVCDFWGSLARVGTKRQSSTPNIRMCASLSNQFTGPLGTAWLVGSNVCNSLTHVARKDVHRKKFDTWPRAFCGPGHTCYHSNLGI